jgi:hypothetical protein
MYLLLPVALRLNSVLGALSTGTSNCTGTGTGDWLEAGTGVYTGTGSVNYYYYSIFCRQAFLKASLSSQ